MLHLIEEKDQIINDLESKLENVRKIFNDDQLDHLKEESHGHGHHGDDHGGGDHADSAHHDEHSGDVVVMTTLQQLHRAPLAASAPHVHDESGVECAQQEEWRQRHDECVCQVVVDGAVDAVVE